MKVKIKRKEIIDLCNWKNPAFGVFANFLDGLLENGYLIVDAEIDWKCEHCGIDVKRGNKTCNDPMCKSKNNIKSWKNKII